MEFYSLKIGKETWRSIPSTPGILASSEGRMLLLPFERTTPSGGKYFLRKSPTLGRNNPSRGMDRYMISVNGGDKLVSRLVCEAFNGPSPKNKPLCLHMDENSLNNKPDNLTWGTQKENLNAPGYVETKKKTCLGASNPNYRHGKRCRGVKRKY